jgi:hypothetical protein
MESKQKSYERSREGSPGRKLAAVREQQHEERAD